MKKIISIVIVLTLIGCAVPATVYASDYYQYNLKREELSDLYRYIESNTDIEGVLKPYTKNSFNVFNSAMDSAHKLLSDNSGEISDSEYQDCIDNLTFAYENMCINEHYAKETYVLSLNENNKNGFYDENDWDDFVEKRDTLRDSFKTADEYVISSAFFALQDSFINMTSKYKMAGDVNNDGKVSVDDATLLQRYLAGMEDLTRVQVALSSNVSFGECWLEVDEPGINNVTYLQKCVADMATICSDDFRYGKTYVDCFDNTFNSLISMYWEFADNRYDCVEAKVAELESEGII